MKKATKKKKKTRVVYRMRCTGCGTTGLHYPNAKKCDICGDPLEKLEKLSRPKK